MGERRRPPRYDPARGSIDMLLGSQTLDMLLGPLTLVKEKPGGSEWNVRNQGPFPLRVPFPSVLISEFFSPLLSGWASARIGAICGS